MVAMVFLVLKLAHPQISMLFWSPDVAIGDLIVHRKHHMIIFTWQSLILRAVYYIMFCLFLLLDCFVFQTAPKLQASKMESSMRHTVVASGVRICHLSKSVFMCYVFQKSICEAGDAANESSARSNSHTLARK